MILLQQQMLRWNLIGNKSMPHWHGCISRAGIISFILAASSVTVHYMWLNVSGGPEGPFEDIQEISGYMAYMWKAGRETFFFYCDKAEVIKNDRVNLLLGSVWQLGYSCTFKDDSLMSDCLLSKRKSQHLPILLNKMFCTDLQLTHCPRAVRGWYFVRKWELEFQSL